MRLPENSVMLTLDENTGLEKTDGGIYIPSTAEKNMEDAVMGEVFMATKPNDENPRDYPVGMKVFFVKYDARTLKYNGVRYYVIDKSLLVLIDV